MLGNQVWYGCQNNSFSRTAVDNATGSSKKKPIKTEDDAQKVRLPAQTACLLLAR